MNQSSSNLYHCSGWVSFWSSRVRNGLACLFICLPMLAFASGSDTNQATQAAPDLTALPLDSLMQLELPKVYAASKVEQKVTEAPASITVITADDIKKQGYQTLGDALQSVP